VSAPAEGRSDAAPPQDADRPTLGPADLEALGADVGTAGAEEVARHVDAARRRGAYPLLALLERLLGGAAAVGTAATPDEERVRLRHDPQLAFRTGEVTRVRVVPSAPGGPPAVEITTAFLGLSGAASPLPPHILEEIAQEDEDAPRQRDFLDLLHHRFISLFYRARARGDWPGGYRSDQSDPWSVRVLALLGRDRRPRLEPWRLLRWAPLLAQRNVTPAAVETAVADVLAEDVGDVGVAVEPFVGGWAGIDPGDENRLGRARSSLGSDLVLGRRILERGGRFRVVIGPLSRDEFARVTGRKEILRKVDRVLAELSPASLEREIVLWLSPEAAPHLELGAARLGRDSWLGGQVKETRLRVDVPA
jgi:type VI secretion system protein ImpH